MSVKKVLVKIWKGFKNGWMKFAHTLGRINTNILLTIFYFILIGIYAIIIGLPKKIIQLISKKPKTYWIEHKKVKDYKYPF
jgi:hypothetical protein